MRSDESSFESDIRTDEDRLLSAKIFNKQGRGAEELGSDDPENWELYLVYTRRLNVSEFMPSFTNSKDVEVVEVVK